MDTISEELKTVILDVASQFVLEAYSERTNLGTADVELETLTTALLKTYQKILSEINK